MSEFERLAPRLARAHKQRLAQIKLEIAVHQLGRAERTESQILVDRALGKALDARKDYEEACQ